MPPSLKLAAPERSHEQRMTALAKANLIRSFRRDIKDRVRSRELDACTVLRSDEPLIQAMRVAELLMCVPGIGRAKLSRILNRDVRVAWSKTIGGLSTRQRYELVLAVKRHMALSKHFIGVRFERRSAA